MSLLEVGVDGVIGRVHDEEGKDQVQEGDGQHVCDVISKDDRKRKDTLKIYLQL